MARKVIAEFDAIDGPFINKLNAIDRSVSRFEVGTLSAFGRVEKGINGLLASAARLQNVSGLLAGGLGTSIATHYIDQATRIRRALREAGDESQEGFEKAFLAAQRSLSGFEAFSQGVQRMSKATGQAFDDSVRDMETLNKLLVLGGKTTQERMSTMIQFSQALQAGVLQGEELRSLRENAPIELIRAIAREAGGTIEDLKKFGMQGKLTTEVMIRALKSLEEQADIRMRNVTLTISEAATTLANAGIVAAESFDKGLGLSRAATGTLTGLAGVLGQSADAAELFGSSVKVAGALLLSSFAGRQMSGVVAGQVAFAKSLKDTAAASLVAEKAAAASLVKSQAVVQARRVEVAALIQKGAAEKTIAVAQSKLTSAQAGLTVATANYTVAVNAAAVAQERLAFSSRAVIAAGNTMRAAWAFLGGWPGLLLTAGTAFYMLSDSAESAADRFARLTSGTDSATTAADALRDVQSRLNDAIAESGRASDDSSRRILANTQKELAAKRELLALETKRLEQLQAERQAEIDRLRGEVEGIYRTADGEVRVQSQVSADPAYIKQIMDDADAKAAAINDKITELNANMVLTGQIIADNNALIAQTGQTMTGLGASVVAMIPGFSSLSQEAQAFASRLYDAWANADGVASTDMASGVAAAAAEAQGLAGWLSAALSRAQAIAREAAAANAYIASNQPGGAGYLANQYAQYGRGRQAFDQAARENSPLYQPFRPQAAAGSVGLDGGGRSGGGSSRQSDIDREALQLIESMMTAEEKRAAQIKEATDLRAQLVEKYGAEHEMVQKVDEAIKRMNETLNEGNTLQEQFWGTMSDHIAQSIDDWRGWGDFVKGLLASLVSKYGEDFFMALFTPGQQSGDSLGTVLGNAITGGFKASAAPSSARLSSSSLKAKAVSLSGSAAKLPVLSSGAGNVTIVNNNDFRGVDNSSRQFVEGKLRELEKSIPAKAVRAVKDAQRKRIF